MFDLKLGHVAAWIKDGGYSSVAIQLPEGLRVRAVEISDVLSRETGTDVIILGDPCYGACDLYTGYHSIAEALVHFGHSRIPSMGDDPDVLYIPADMDLDVRDAVKNALPQLGQRIGLLATVQYLRCLAQAKEVIEGEGRTALIGEGDSRVQHPGQVLGCNCTAAFSVVDDVDCFLYIGEGDFHPLAAAFSIGKPIKVLNPVTGELRSVDEARDRILRRRFAAIVSAKMATSFLVIVSSKPGQNRSELADRLVERIRAKGMKAYKAVMNELSPQSLMAYSAEVFVCTACPRIAMDDAARYDRPIITPTELDVVLGDCEWDDYVFDQITG